MQVKTKNLAVIGLVTVLLLTLWYRMVYSPIQAKATKANAAAEDATQRISTLERKARQLEAESTDKKKQDDATVQLNDAIPVTPELANFLRATDAIRVRSGVSFQSITPSAPTLVNGLQTTNVGIIVQGEYRQVISYLDELASNKRLVVIDNVSFTTSGSTGTGDGSSGGGPTGEVFAGVGAAPNLQAQLTARVFSQAPAGVAAAASGSTSSGAQSSGSPAAGNSGQAGTSSPPGVNNN